MHTRRKHCRLEGNTSTCRYCSSLYNSGHHFFHVEKANRNCTTYKRGTLYSRTPSPPRFNFIRGRVVPTWIGHNTHKSYNNGFSSAIERPEGAAPKRKPRANYKSISDDLLKDFLSNIMKERLQEDLRKLGQNPTQKQLECFKKAKFSQKFLPRDIVGKLLERLGEKIDTSGMDTLGLTSRLSKIKGFDKMQAWRDAV